ncbi:hypothetical protein BAUCODRAFT_131289 [Baudoinia panamericana UAMH 10762]|uniref:Alcohol dehydrogenase-like C-terminal domain-containing protein n=1 Tax=Baudoinia panamericana (strain UAMH 10762) TaxID=717646 RepID=M2NC71_BAUPA|nr:uncharacterized protein BAUCODRAFT_131289 [Baudoinia panamericana UAMH 10762]EMC96774.1 hypothetical protein BAUCODRAFT_131289 [Baudoinia panamericana UAMH 10762]
MKVVRVVGYHKNLELDEAPEPKVTGPLDVIVKIGAAGVCRVSMIQPEERRGTTSSNVRLDGHPYPRGATKSTNILLSLGNEQMLTESGHTAPSGDLWLVHCLPVWRRRALRRQPLPRIFRVDAYNHTNSLATGYAEYLKTTARSVIKLDDSLEPADVAALADAGLTAYHAVAKAAKLLRPGNICVMIGAGGLGHIGVQVMKAISAAILIVIDSNPDALKLAKDLGADHTVQAGDDGKFVQEVLDLTKGKGAEAVIDFVAEGGSTATGVKMLRRAGNYYVVGYGENINVPTIDIISTEINFVSKARECFVAGH